MGNYYSVIDDVVLRNTESGTNHPMSMTQDVSQIQYAQILARDAHNLHNDVIDPLDPAVWTTLSGDSLSALATASDSPVTNAENAAQVFSADSDDASSWWVSDQVLTADADGNQVVTLTIMFAEPVMFNAIRLFKTWTDCLPSDPDGVDCNDDIGDGETPNLDTPCFVCDNCAYNAVATDMTCANDAGEINGEFDVGEYDNSYKNACLILNDENQNTCSPDATDEAADHIELQKQMDGVTKVQVTFDVSDDNLGTDTTKVPSVNQVSVASIEID